VVTIVCGFANEGNTPLNVSGIMGSVNNPLNFKQYYQNLTGVAVGEVVDAGSEAALEYRFQLPLPEAMEVQVALTVFYEDDDEYFTTTFFNETISFVEAPKPWDARTVVPYVAGVAMVAAVAIMLRAALSEAPRGGRSGPATSTAADDLTYQEQLARERKSRKAGSGGVAAPASGGKKEQ
jgi:translocon-associated protein subunit alpha